MAEVIVVALTLILIALAFALGRHLALTEVRNLCGETLNKTPIPFPDLWDIDTTVNKQAYTQGRLDAINEIFVGLSTGTADTQKGTQ